MKFYYIRDALKPTDKPSGSFQRLINRLHRSQSLKQVVQYLLPAEEAKHCVATQLQGSTLTIVADSSSWATRIRFMKSVLLDSIRRLADYTHVEKIVVKTDARPPSPSM